MTVQDPRVPSGMTDMYRSGGYNPAAYTSSPSYRSSKQEETLPDWVVNNNKVLLPAHCICATNSSTLPELLTAHSFSEVSNLKACRHLTSLDLQLAAICNPDASQQDVAAEYCLLLDYIPSTEQLLCH